MAEKELSIVLAGGGSAGHTSPLIATAQELTELRPDARLTVVGTARGLETRTIPDAGLTLRLIPPVPMPRKPGLELLKVPFRLRQAVNASAELLREVAADVVVGFGGYVSTPVYLAARRLRVPIVIHEQNALPGLANRLAARFARVVATSFPGTALPKAEVIGLPLRRSITGFDRNALRPHARETFGLHPELPTLLVSGGSQGAQRLNQAVIGGVEALLSQGIQVVHVLGPKNLTAAHVEVVDAVTGAVYRPLAFVERMEEAYAAADLMLGRCGASTVMETAAVGLPALFVPFPIGNGEQARNATVMVEAGGAELIADEACTTPWLLSRVPVLMGDPEVLRGMAEAARSVAHADAGKKLAAMTLEVVH